ncbi:hypothetical protein EJB05_02583 [Eragrostis curvula]|uniref:RNA helicase n=1 Tax=Eragrostis curvula TaxID=38414 RepID=A0A5J9WVL4_9POAL|nr:hypothetical protein EJB05_02583 [Eragrostis curvula]
MASNEEVEVAGVDGEAPARQATTFAELGLCPELVAACDAMGWTAPTRIQAEAIPCALQGKDVVALAQTGSGKTAAFVLPILQALLETTPRPFFACVLSPKRELAIQIADQFRALGSAIGLVCSVLVGGVDRVQQAISLAKRPHIVVATPGRLLDHLMNTKGFALDKMKYLVLDEADELLHVEFEKALNDILKVIPKDRITFLFSATMTKKVNKLKRACIRVPAKLEVASKYSTADLLSQKFYLVPANDKDCYLVHVLKMMLGSRIMVFVRTCDSADLLARVLRNLGFKAICIHGQMSQDKRLGALNRFKAKECNILACTDLASRGLDIQGVDLVINFDIPKNPKDYVHRVGRTARAGKSGCAVSLVNQYEVLWFKKIELLLGKEIIKCEVDESEIKTSKECISDAKRMALTSLKESGWRREMLDDEDEIVDHIPCKRPRFSLKSLKRRSSKKQRY